MANKPKQSSETRESRRAKVEALRRQQQAQDRRRTLMYVAGAVLVGLVIIGAAGFALFRETMNDPARQDWADFGVPAASASCDPVIDEQATGNNVHRPTGEIIEYDSAPPAYGPHYGFTAPYDRDFYTPDDTPQIEQLIHNLEHGFSILWYDPDIDDATLSTLEHLADKVTSSEDVAEQVSGRYFTVAAWDTTRGEFPEGKSYALTHWGADSAHRQYCGELSGEVVRDFVTAYPASDAPEPGAGFIPGP